jgi:hypothetical protein
MKACSYGALAARQPTGGRRLACSHDARRPAPPCPWAAQDALDEIARQKPKDLFKPLRVHFIGEDGIDAGEPPLHALLLGHSMRASIGAGQVSQPGVPSSHPWLQAA